MVMLVYTCTCPDRLMIVHVAVTEYVCHSFRYAEGFCFTNILNGVLLACYHTKLFVLYLICACGGALDNHVYMQRSL